LWAGHSISVVGPFTDSRTVEYRWLCTKNYSLSLVVESLAEDSGVTVGIAGQIEAAAVQIDYRSDKETETWRLAHACRHHFQMVAFA